MAASQSQAVAALRALCAKLDGKPPSPEQLADALSWPVAKAAELLKHFVPPPKRGGSDGLPSTVPAEPSPKVKAGKLCIYGAIWFQTQCLTVLALLEYLSSTLEPDMFCWRLSQRLLLGWKWSICQCQGLGLKRLRQMVFWLGC